MALQLDFVLRGAVRVPAAYHRIVGISLSERGRGPEIRVEMAVYRNRGARESNPGEPVRVVDVDLSGRDALDVLNADPVPGGAANVWNRLMAATYTKLRTLPQYAGAIEV